MTQTPPSRGWYVEVDHPTSGHTFRPGVARTPQRSPAANDLPTISIPVRRDERWLESVWEGAPMRVWFDGARQPIDELETVRVTPDGASLEGRGGIELIDTHLTPEYDFEEIHVAARDLIQNNTTYTANVDTPETTRTNNVEVQGTDADPIDTNSEFNSILSPGEIADTDPLEVRNDNIELLQSGFLAEAGTSVSDSDASNGDAGDLINNGDQSAWTATIDYTIPADNVKMALRWRADDDVEPDGTFEHPGFNLEVNNETVFSENVGGRPDRDYLWSKGNAQYSGGDLTAGDHDYRVVIDGDNGASLITDVLFLYDDRFSYAPNDVFDNTVDANGYLSNPALYPNGTDLTQFVFNDSETVEAIVGGRVESTLDDTTGDQRIQVSNDRGATWKPDDGSEDNTDTVAHDFANPGPTLRSRFRLSRYGTRTTATPTEGFNGQKLQSYNLKADTEDVPLVVDQQFDGQLRDVLRDLADLGDFVWEYRRDGDTESIEWAQTNQRTSSKTASVASYDVQKSVTDIVERARVKGTSLTVRDEEITADHGTAVDLNNDRLISAQERVFDSSQVYERGGDYEVDYQNGTITTLADGEITDGNTVNVDYRHKPFNSVTASGVSSPRTQTFDIASVTTDRGAGIVADLLVQDLQDPIWQIQVTIPHDEAGWSVVDDIDLSSVPTAGTAHHINGVTNTPRETILTLASRRSAADAVEDIENRIQTTTRKV